MYITIGNREAATYNQGSQHSEHAGEAVHELYIYPLMIYSNNKVILKNILIFNESDNRIEEQK